MALFRISCNTYPQMRDRDSDRDNRLHTATIKSLILAQNYYRSRVSNLAKT